MCLVIGLLGYQDSFITSLSVTGSIPETQKGTAILPLTPYVGQFIASYDRLGVVKIRISTGGRLNTNTVVFRLRERGQKTWLVQNAYVTDRFPDGEFYPFGFPVIENSKGKTYEYELTTSDGSAQNTIKVLPGSYAFQSQYIYSSALIRSDGAAALWFLQQKLVELFGTLPHLGYWFMCMLPLFMLTDAYVAAAIGMIALYGFLPVQIDTNIVLWIGAAVLGTALYKKKYRLPFLLALVTLIGSVLAYLFHAYHMAGKLATIVPLLLAAGGITIWKSGF